MSCVFVSFMYLVYKCRFMLPPLVMTISVTVLPTRAPNLALCTQDLFTCKVCTWGNTIMQKSVPHLKTQSPQALM